MVSSQQTLTQPTSSWRRIFEEVRRAVGHRRDETGVVGSINWLRKEMERRGANPNVVRNIIYRDKGKLADKRVLFTILRDLWATTGQPPLQAPDLEVLLSQSLSAEQEVLQLLGREKRRAYQGFVNAVRSGLAPKLLVTGKPGSGKTLLSDYIQQALEMAPKAADHIVRLELGSHDFASSLSRLASALGVSQELFESRLVKISASGAYSVQADAQAEVARVLFDALRSSDESWVLLLHLSQSLSRQESLGLAPLRLNTPEVPRVNASEWLWLSLLEPLSRLGNVSMLVSSADIPARVLQQLGRFEGPVKLNPPTVNEARRFVKVRLPQLTAQQQEALVKQSNRSFEELRTLTLLAEIREPVETQESDAHLEQLSSLVVRSGDAQLRDFLAALAVLSLPEFPTFAREALSALRPQPLSNLEQAFLDPAPGHHGAWRCFSRQLARRLREQLYQHRRQDFTALSAAASRYYAPAAFDEPGGEAAVRYLHHLLDARDWERLEHWLSRHSVPQVLLRRLWRTAQLELASRDALERIAQQVAAHYVKLGSNDHPDAQEALATLADSHVAERRAWTQLKRAEGAVVRGDFEEAEALVKDWPDSVDDRLKAERALVQASIARWRSQLERAAELIEREARARLPRIPPEGGESKLLHAKVAVWAGLVAKDQGELDGALREFESVETDDELVRARLAFQLGDVRLKLGYFDGAKAALDEAVRLAQRSEAPAFEQARYLARRGALKRKRGEFEKAEEDFATALAVIDHSAEEHGHASSAFALAKVRDEQAVNLLAQGRFAEAIDALGHNLDLFCHYQQTHRVDASFRVLRSSLRLALAYWCRGLAQPYRLPFLRYATPLSGPDVAHAERLLEGALASMKAHPDGVRRFGPLHRHALLSLSLVTPDAAKAVELASASLAGARYPYLRAESHATLAAARWRRGDEAAWDELERATRALALVRHDGERSNLGLEAWLLALELRLLVSAREVQQAGRKLAAALARGELAPYHEGLLRSYGEAIEAVPGERPLQTAALKALGLPTHIDAHVRFPDALVYRWRRLERAPVLS